MRHLHSGRMRTDGRFLSPRGVVYSIWTFGRNFSCVAWNPEWCFPREECYYFAVNQSSWLAKDRHLFSKSRKECPACVYFFHISHRKGTSSWNWSIVFCVDLPQLNFDSSPRFQRYMKRRAQAHTATEHPDPFKTHEVKTHFSLKIQFFTVQLVFSSAAVASVGLYIRWCHKHLQVTYPVFPMVCVFTFCPSFGCRGTPAVHTTLKILSLNTTRLEWMKHRYDSENRQGRGPKRSPVRSLHPQTPRRTSCRSERLANKSPANSSRGRRDLFLMEIWTSAARTRCVWYTFKNKHLVEGMVPCALCRSFAARGVKKLFSLETPSP